MEVNRKQMYECDYCKKVSEWGKSWTAVTWLVEAGYSGWEHEFHLCSEECYWMMKRKNKPERRKMAFEILKRRYR